MERVHSPGKQDVFRLAPSWANQTVLNVKEIKEHDAHRERVACVAEHRCGAAERR